MADTNIRVMLVDDHEMVRKGLAVFLETIDDLELVGEASSGVAAVALCAKLQPDVLLMDLLMPGEMDGVTAIAAIRQQAPEVQIVVLTSFYDDTLVQDALSAGAIGYLLKNTTIDELAGAIRAAHRGEPRLAPEATQALIRATTRPAPPAFVLTDREMEVLAHMAEGETNRQIAQVLSLSPSTIKFYVSSILSKMGVSSRTEAVSLALKHAIISISDTDESP